MHISLFVQRIYIYNFNILAIHDYRHWNRAQTDLLSKPGEKLTHGSPTLKFSGLWLAIGFNW